jgi:hypothetical protein
VGEGLAVAVLAVAGMGTVGRAALGMGLERWMDQTPAPMAPCPGGTAAFTARQVVLAPSGVTALDAARQPATWGSHRGMAGMTQAAVGFANWADLAPAPTARSTREDGSPSQSSEVASQAADRRGQLAKGYVLPRERPEHRTSHPLGDHAVSLQEAGDPCSFAVGAAADVAGEGPGDSRAAAAMDQDPDLGAVAQGSGTLVEPERLLDIACLVSEAAALS